MLLRRGCRKPVSDQDVGDAVKEYRAQRRHILVLVLRVAAAVGFVRNLCRVSMVMLKIVLAQDLQLVPVIVNVVSSIQSVHRYNVFNTASNHPLPHQYGRLDL